MRHPILYLVLAAYALAAIVIVWLADRRNAELRQGTAVECVLAGFTADQCTFLMRFGR